MKPFALPPTTPERAALQQRLDAWANLLTGVGTERDKRTYSEVQTTAKIPFEVLRDLYRSNALAARICERPSEEMTREWIEVKIADEKDAGEAVETWLDTIGARQAFRLGSSWRRGYGGAGALLGVNKGEVSPQDLAAPLEDFIRAGKLQSVDHLTVFSARELQTVAYYSDPIKPSFAEPAMFRIVPQVPFGISGQQVSNFGSTMLKDVEVGAPTHPWSILPEVHESWILRFDGVIADRRQRLENWGWGDSVLQRVYEKLRDFDMTWDSASNLLQDFAQGIFTIPGLMGFLATDDGRETLRLRMEMLDKMRSNARSIVLDGGEAKDMPKEEFRREVASIAGIPEVLVNFGYLLASAADMPITLLLGMQTKGLGNGGEADQRWWYDHVADMQRFQLEPQLRRLISIGLQAKQGPTKGQTFEGKPWSIFFRPLWQLDEVQQAAVRKTIAETDQINIGQGIYSPEEARSSHYSGDGFSVEVQLDEETRGAFEATDPKEGEGDPMAVDPKALAAGELSVTSGQSDIPDAKGVKGQSIGQPGAGVGSSDLQQLALNGTQITGLLAILSAVRDGSLPEESAVIALCTSFPFAFDEVKARAIVKPIEVKEAPEPTDPIELEKAKAQARAGAFGAPPPVGKQPPPKG